MKTKIKCKIKSALDNVFKKVYNNQKGEKICLIHLFCGIGINNAFTENMFCECYFACHKTYEWIKTFII